MTTRTPRTRTTLPDETSVDDAGIAPLLDSGALLRAKLVRLEAEPQRLLAAALEIAAPEVAASLRAPIPADVQRSDIIAALANVAALLNALGGEQHEAYVVEHPVASLLRRLSDALADLNLGVVDPLLRRKNTGGTSKAPTSRQKKAETAYALYWALRATGEPQATTLQKIGKVMGEKPETIRMWSQRVPGRRK